MLMRRGSSSSRSTWSVQANKNAEAVIKTFLSGVFDRNRGSPHLRVMDIIVHILTEYGQVEN